MAVLSPQDVRAIIRRGGFDSLVLFFQAGMIHTWAAKRSSFPIDGMKNTSCNWEEKYDGGKDVSKIAKG